MQRRSAQHNLEVELYPTGWKPERLAEIYVSEGIIPAKFTYDALHNSHCHNKRFGICFQLEFQAHRQNQN
jgi:hypothetical protein